MSELEKLAEKWESEIEMLGELSKHDDIVGPIESIAKLQCVIELRYVIENGKMPSEEFEGRQYTEIVDKAPPEMDNFIETNTN